MKWLATVLVALGLACGQVQLVDSTQPTLQIETYSPHYQKVEVGQPFVHSVLVGGAYVEKDSDSSPVFYIMVGQLDGKVAFLQWYDPMDAAYRQKQFTITFGRALFISLANPLTVTGEDEERTVQVAYTLYRMRYADYREDMTPDEKLAFVLAGYPVARVTFAVYLTCPDCSPN